MNENECGWVWVRHVIGARADRKTRQVVKNDRAVHDFACMVGEV